MSKTSKFIYLVSALSMSCIFDSQNPKNILLGDWEYFWTDQKDEVAYSLGVYSDSVIIYEWNYIKYLRLDSSDSVFSIGDTVTRTTIKIIVYKNWDYFDSTLMLKDGRGNFHVSNFGRGKISGRNEIIVNDEVTKKCILKKSEMIGQHDSIIVSDSLIYIKS